MKTNAILTLAGSDILSGGGLQADLTTFASHGLHGFLALTCLTTVREKGFNIVPISTILYAQELDSLREISFSAIKVGLLPTLEIAKLSLEFVEEHPDIPIVLDPVLVFKENQDTQVNPLVHELRQFLPHVSILTPNLKEAELLTQRKIQSVEEMQEAAKTLIHMGAKAVLVKGGKRLGVKEAIDVFYDGQTMEVLRSPLLPQNTNGAGCSLASSIASHLAFGKTTLEAVRLSKDFVYRAIQEANEYGVRTYDGK